MTSRLSRARTVTRAKRWAFHRLKKPHDREFYALERVPNIHGLVLDIGAHEGQAALSLSAICPGHRIVSIEANPFVLPELSRTYNRYRIHGSIIHAAVSDSNSEVRLSVPQIGRFLSSQGASLRPDFIGARTRDFCESYGQAPDRLVEVMVKGMTVDELGVDADLIKIDVEGAEAAVIRGATATIARSRPWIFLEVRGSGGEAESLLRDLGYQIAFPTSDHSQNTTDVPSPGQVNALCRPLP